MNNLNFSLLAGLLWDPMWFWWEDFDQPIIKSITCPTVKFVAPADHRESLPPSRPSSLNTEPERQNFVVPSPTQQHCSQNYSSAATRPPIDPNGRRSGYPFGPNGTWAGSWQYPDESFTNMKRLKKNPDDDDDLARHPDHCGLSDGCFGSVFSVCGSQWPTFRQH